MKEIRFRVSDEQYDRIMRVSGKRKKSVRAMVLRMFFELDHTDQKGKKDGR